MKTRRGSRPRSVHIWRVKAGMLRSRLRIICGLAPLFVLLVLAPAALGQVDVSVSQTQSAATPLVGEELTYFVTLTATGGTATNVVLTDTLPANVQFVRVSASVPCQQSGGTVTCTVSSIPDGGSGTGQIVVRPTAEGPITNTAHVASDQDPDANTSNNDSQLSSVVARGQADLRVSQTQSTPNPAVGSEFSYSLNVANDGPNQATNVSIVDTLPAGVEFVRVDAPIPCQPSGATVTCTVQSIPAGGAGGGQIVVRPTLAGPITNQLSAGSEQTDPNSGNNSSQLSSVVTALPQAGRSVNVRVASGRVLIRRPGQSGFTRLTADQQIPVGSIVDTRHGAVQITAAADLTGGLATGTFSKGLFKIAQRRTSHPITELTLTGGNFAACRATSHPRAIAARARRVRSLFGNAHGRFRTRGRNSSATVRGTRWSVQDRCDGTLTSVTRGTVTVRDFVRRRNVTVRKGHSYLARARH